jgi:thioredoxin-related protein
MNKYIVGGLVAVLVVMGVVFVASGDDTDTTAAPNNSAATVSDSPQAEAESVASEESEETVEVARYIEYSEANLASTKDTKQVVFFHAPWCSTCIAFEKEIIAQGVPAGMTILKADYDTETDLKQKYEVRLQSTFVLLDADGNVQQAWPSGQGLSNDISNLYDQVI